MRVRARVCVCETFSNSKISKLYVQYHESITIIFIVEKSALICTRLLFHLPYILCIAMIKRYCLDAKIKIDL